MLNGKVNQEPYVMCNAEKGGKGEGRVTYGRQGKGGTLKKRVKS